MDEPNRDDVVRAHFRIRKNLSWLGMALPVRLMLGGWYSQGAGEPSISD